MARLTWDETSKKLYETGSKMAVLYPMGESGTYDAGVAWNGFLGVSESPSGAEATALYANDAKYLSLYSAEEFGGTIKAYTYPDEFAECNGEKEIADGVHLGQQDRKSFGLCYRTIVGNDVKKDAYGYKIHLVYGCMVSPSEKEFNSVNDSPEAIEFNWEFTTTPVNVDGFKPTASIVIDSTKADPECLKKLEDKLYGDASEGTATLPLPDEVKTIMSPLE